MIKVIMSIAAQEHMQRTRASQYDMCGLLFEGLNETNPMTAVEQLDASYRHGGGWHDFKGFTLKGERLCYPGDPAMTLIASAKLRDETVMLFEGAWVCVLHANGTINVARMD